MQVAETSFKVTVESRSAEAANKAIAKLKHFTKNVANVVVEIVGTVVYMTFDAVRTHSLTILGSIKDLLGMSYQVSISSSA